MPGPVEARRRYIVALLAMLQNAGKPLPSADMLGWKGSEAFLRSPCLAKADRRLAIDAQTNSGRIPTTLNYLIYKQPRLLIFKISLKSVRFLTVII